MNKKSNGNDCVNMEHIKQLKEKYNVSTNTLAEVMDYQTHSAFIRKIDNKYSNTFSVDDIVKLYNYFHSLDETVSFMDFFIFNNNDDSSNIEQQQKKYVNKPNRLLDISKLKLPTNKSIIRRIPPLPIIK